MFLKRLSLQNFRNHHHFEINFSKKRAVVVGPNMIGKSNLLEAVRFLSLGRSPKIKNGENLITSGESFFRIRGEVDDVSDKTTLEVYGESGNSVDNHLSKRYLVNGVSRRSIDFVGNLKAVYFGPEDIEMVTSTPDVRRTFLNTVLAQVDKKYASHLIDYQRVIIQRNHLLKRVRSNLQPYSDIAYWNESLLSSGLYLSSIRCSFFKFIAEFLPTLSPLFSNLLPFFETKYKPSVLSLESLLKLAQREILAGVTLIGPHRDDFEFYSSGGNLAQIGSRAQQRLAVLILRLAELEFIRQKSAEEPILLLDDLFSEFDPTRRQELLRLLGEGPQIILTTADLGLVDDNFLREAEVIELGR
ncbi:MAG: DNA replication and repair protein RecF [bacterium]|nr:DNA replication and repair protein RecF [bacterium]